MLRWDLVEELDPESRRLELPPLPRIPSLIWLPSRRTAPRDRPVSSLSHGHLGRNSGGRNTLHISGSLNYRSFSIYRPAPDETLSRAKEDAAHLSVGAWHISGIQLC